MKLVLLSLVLFVSSAFGQTTIDRKIACGDAIQAIATLKENYKEEPILRFVRDGDQSVIVVVFANIKTGSTTTLEIYKNGIACDISGGTDLQINTKILNKNYGTGV